MGLGLLWIGMLTVLAWLGRQGARALAVVVVIGVAVPPLGHLLRPYLTEAVVVLLAMAFLRADMAALRQHFRRPALILGATLWTSADIPVLFRAAAGMAGLRGVDSGLFASLLLQGLAPPMMVAPALAALMGLDATLVLITLVTSTALVPFLVPFLVQLVLGGTLAVPPLALGGRLAAILAGSLLVAAVGRRLIGADAIRKHGDALNGVNVVVLLVFVSAVMGNVAAEAVANPATFVGVTALVFAVFGLLLLLTALIFRRAGRIEALCFGIMASQRNMGLMFAAVGGTLPGSAWLYFALCQLPIYLSPLVLRRFESPR